MDVVFPSASAPTPPPPIAPLSTATNARGAEDRSTTFRPVEGDGELQSGEKLLVEAYAAIWLILFALVLVSWRKQRAVDARIDTLEASLTRARAADDARRGVDRGT